MITVLCSSWLFMQGQTNWTGVYSFNKGINKDQGTLYVQQFKSDSAYFYLNFISALPDFDMFAMKGFIAIQENEGYFRKVDSLRLRFHLQGSALQLLSDTLLVAPKGLLSKYKKTASQVKKNSTLYLDYVEKSGLVKSDSAVVLEVPHLEGKMIATLHANDEVKIIDSFAGFYLIELNDKLKEFLWVQKKYISLNKK